MPLVFWEKNRAGYVRPNCNRICVRDCELVSRQVTFEMPREDSRTVSRSVVEIRPIPNTRDFFLSNSMKGKGRVGPELETPTFLESEFAAIT